jgi:hypothetical protein
MTPKKEIVESTKKHRHRSKGIKFRAIEILGFTAENKLKEKDQDTF